MSREFVAEMTHSTTRSSRIKLSVLVATKNRSESLSNLLQALAAQQDTPDFEVIVANNGSTDDTAQIARGFDDALSLQILSVPQPGKSRALNQALRLAVGELLVFTDDDVVPAADWLAKLWKAALDWPEVRLFGGPIRVAEDRLPRWVARSFNLSGLLAARYDLGDTDRVYPPCQYPIGPNMAVRKDALAGCAKPFPETIGPGTSSPVGDESCFGMTVSDPVAKDRLYVASAHVEHRPLASNFVFGTAVRRSFMAGRARGRLGLPSVVSEKGQAVPHATLVVARLQTLRSAREIVCLASRYLGFLIGRRQYHR